ncbi:MAG TPA: TIR domain-containing protein [Flavilitoribacter sp.]|nr:TIR domain-containing protein [Flavilitoribacter sp.]HMQ87175.1 TIR domain-containing protein [Flavilitoribacter sp.]
MHQIRQLIVQNRLREALLALADAAPTHLQNDATLLQNRYHQYEQGKMRGTLYPSEAEVERNRIVSSALDLCNLVEAEKPAQRPAARSANNPAPKPGGKKIFFSYSKADRSVLEELLRHIKPLVREGKLQPWNDHDILPGDDWDDEVREKLETADIFLFLISANSISTDYILDVEMPIAMGRHDRGEARVIPIFIKPCEWDSLPLSKLNGLPSKGKPVTAYADRDEAWVEVVKGIKRVLD